MFQPRTFQSRTFAPRTFAGSAVVVIEPVSSGGGGGGTFRIFGYIPETPKKKRELDVVVEANEIKYASIQGPVNNLDGIVDAVADLQVLLKNHSIRSYVTKKKIQELQDEEDITIILTLL